MRVLLTGAYGQVGWELIRCAPEGVELLATDADTLDITRAEAVSSRVEDFRPDLILNCAAYTAVDRAEEESEVAFAVNREGASNLARAASAIGARMVHYSTDFVFGGDQGSPYRPEDRTGPLSVYGESKREGEVAVLDALGDGALVIRSSWLYSTHGGNFVKTMLRLMAERDELKVVTDQVGVPTYAADLARATWLLVDRPAAKRILHVTNSGVASWYDFAMAIRDEALALGMLGSPPKVLPIPTSGYPVSANRPPYSVLDSGRAWGLLGSPLPHWRASLAGMLKELRDVDHA